MSALAWERSAAVPPLADDEVHVWRIELAPAPSALARLGSRLSPDERREYEEERTQPASQELLQLARLRRNREALVAEFGERMYQVAEASAHWLPYILLGKLLPVMYVLAHEGES